MKKAILILIILLVGAGTLMSKADTYEFLKGLDYNNGLSVVKEILRAYPLQYAGTIGLDGKPQVRPIEFKFEEDGVLYFDTVSIYTSYKELLRNPYIEICVSESETMSYLRLSGRVNFTKDKDIVERCFASSPILSGQFGDKRELVIAYYLTEARAEFSSLSKDLPHKVFSLRNKYDY